MKKHLSLITAEGFPGGSDGKESACSVGDLGLIPESGRSPGEGHGNSLQYACLENSMDRGAWWATVWGHKRVGHDLATRQQQSIRITTFIYIYIYECVCALNQVDLLKLEYR